MEPEPCKNLEKKLENPYAMKNLENNRNQRKPGKKPWENL